MRTPGESGQVVLPGFEPVAETFLRLMEGRAGVRRSASISTEVDAFYGCLDRPTAASSPTPPDTTELLF